MPAITQPLSFGSYVGVRYGSFAGKGNPPEPDFLRGSLNLYLSLDGEIRMQPWLSGQSQFENHLLGRIEVNP